MQATPTKAQDGFLTLVKADVKRWNQTPGLLGFLALLFLQPGFQLALSIRVQQTLQKIPFAGQLLCKVLWYLTCITFNCHCSSKAAYGKGLYFPHPCAIVIGDSAAIGDNVTIYQSVTLGIKSAAENSYPVINDNVVIYAGAQVLGPVQIGAHTAIGGNAVVTKNVPPGAIAAGIPARIIRQAPPDQA